MACCILYGMLYGMLYGCGVAIEAYSIQLPNSTVLHSNKLCSRPFSTESFYEIDRMRMRVRCRLCIQTTRSHADAPSRSA